MSAFIAHSSITNKMETHPDYHSRFYPLVIGSFYKLSDISSIHSFSLYMYIIIYSFVILCVCLYINWYYLYMLYMFT